MLRRSRPGKTEVWQAIRSNGEIFKTRIIFFNEISKRWLCIYSVHDPLGYSVHDPLGRQFDSWQVSCFVCPIRRQSRASLIGAMLRYDTGYKTELIWRGV